MEPRDQGKSSTKSTPALIAMIATITIANVLLVTSTSLGLLMRALISIALGMGAVALVYWLSRRRGS